jgi:hypothetical protein
VVPQSSRGGELQHPNGLAAIGRRHSPSAGQSAAEAHALTHSVLTQSKPDGHACPAPAQLSSSSSEHAPPPFAPTRQR